jgi:hypothetical protein
MEVVQSQFRERPPETAWLCFRAGANCFLQPCFALRYQLRGRSAATKSRVGITAVSIPTALARLAAKEINAARTVLSSS